MFLFGKELHLLYFCIQLTYFLLFSVSYCFYMMLIFSIDMVPKIVVYAQKGFSLPKCSCKWALLQSSGEFTKRVQPVNTQLNSYQVCQNYASDVYKRDHSCPKNKRRRQIFLTLDFHFNYLKKMLYLLLSLMLNALGKLSIFYVAAWDPSGPSA